MAGDINRVPWGLLSLLDTQTQGIVPSVLSDNVQPTISLDGFYRSTLRPRQTVATDAAFLLQNAYVTAATVTVPQGYLWQVINVSCSALNNEAAGTPVALHIGADLTGGAGFRSILTPFCTAATTSPTATQSVGLTWAEGIWAVAGSTFVPYCERLTTAPVSGQTITLYVSYYEFRV